MTAKRTIGYILFLASFIFLLMLVYEMAGWLGILVVILAFSLMALILYLIQ